MRSLLTWLMYYFFAIIFITYRAYMSLLHILYYPLLSVSCYIWLSSDFLQKVWSVELTRGWQWELNSRDLFIVGAMLSTLAQQWANDKPLPDYASTPTNLGRSYYAVCYEDCRFKSASLHCSASWLRPNMSSQQRFSMHTPPFSVVVRRVTLS